MIANKYEIRGLPARHSVVLRRKREGQVWTARIKVPQSEARHDFGRIERSTGFRDLDPAIAQAHKLYSEVLNPLPTPGRNDFRAGMSFSEAVQLFLEGEQAKTKSRERSVAQYERERISLLRHFVPALGEMALAGITKRHLSSFVTKRRLNQHLPTAESEIVYQRAGKVLRYRKATQPPTVETLRRERSAFNALMKWASEEGHIDEYDVPSFPIINGKGARRSHFGDEAIQHLQHVSISRILRANHAKHRRDRLFCHLRMMTIYLTGCRPQEVARLRFGDIEPWINRDNKPTYKIKLNAHQVKHPSHARSVVALPEFAYIFERIRFEGLGYNDDDFLFAGPDRKVMGPCNGSFRRLVKEAAATIPFDRPGAKFDPANPYYSLRHTFITERIYESVDLGEIARWCGTSHEMIQEHYNHVSTEVEQSPKVDASGRGPYLVPIPRRFGRIKNMEREFSTSTASTVTQRICRY